jgi:hypothetical protein
MKNLSSVLLRNLGTLILLALAFPLNFVIVIAALIWNWIGSPFRKQQVINSPQNILLTGGK